MWYVLYSSEASSMQKMQAPQVLPLVLLCVLLGTKKNKKEDTCVRRVLFLFRFPRNSFFTVPFSLSYKSKYHTNE